MKRKQLTAESDSEDDDEDVMPSTKFRRGEALPSDLEFGDDSCGSDDPPDEIDDGEWNMMGAALEREFLSGSGDWSCLTHHRCVVTPKFCMHVLFSQSLEFF